MASNESIIKETKTNLESAQKALLKEINVQKNPLQRLFSNGQSKGLAAVQSFLAKALNQLGNLSAGGGNQNAAKLQANLSQKDIEIKALEEKLKESEDKASELDGKINFLENQTKNLEAKLAKKTEEAARVPEAVSSSPEAQTNEAPNSETSTSDKNEFETKVEKLKQDNKDLVEKFKQSETERREAQNLAAEINVRLKRLKTEVICS